MTDAAASARIPSLDGFRGVSILLVLFGHLAGTRGAPDWLTRLRHGLFVDVANLGVRVFFVISGLLITLLLMREVAKTGRVSLRHFYWRRAFRILPAYLAFIGASVVAWRLGWVTLVPRDLVHALTFTVNYDGARSWGIGHLWSLSVEEQFYLLWPAAIAFGGLAGGARWARALLLVGPVARLAWLALGPAQAELNGATFETAADAVAVGCLLALYRDRLWEDPRWRRVVESPWVLPVAWTVALALASRTRLELALAIPLQNLCIGATIERAVRQPGAGLGRVLNWRPIATIGLYSYSIYLWQQPFLNRTAPGALTSFPVNVACVAVLALVSYWWVEQPMLALRERIEARWAARRRLAA